MKMSYDDRRLWVSRGLHLHVIPQDLINARVRTCRNVGVVNSLYVCQDRLSNVIVRRYRTAAVLLRDEAR